MGSKFRVPPKWPTPPPGWKWTRDWKPDPSWPKPPPDWVWWEPDDEGDGQSAVVIPDPPSRDDSQSAGVIPDPPHKSRTSTVIGGAGVLLTVVGLVLAWITWYNPDPASQLSSREERQSYIAEVDELCGRFLTAYASLDMGSTIETREDAVRVIESRHRFSEELEILRTDWQSVPPPKETDTKVLRPALDALESMKISTDNTTSSLERVLSGAEIDQEVMASELAQLDEHASEFRRLSREYGFNVCPQIGT
jgi:hypothetical protein